MKKQKHKEDLKFLILEAAKKLFVQEGYAATSIRKIANEIGFSPTTIYLYYKDKNDIVYALHQEGFTLLRDRFAPLMAVDEPYERLKAIGRNYIDFALNNTEYYEVMFMMKEPMDFLDTQCEPDLWPEGQRVLDFLKMTIEDCKAHGYFEGMDSNAVSLQAWASVHGLIALNITEHLVKLKEELAIDKNIKELIYSSFEVLLTLMIGRK